MAKNEIIERHRHRYEVNNNLLPAIEAAGLKVSGRSAQDNLVEMIELPDHPWFVGCQFHPEFTSTPRDGHPLFTGFIRAAKEYQVKNIRRDIMQVCGFEVGLDQPFFLIAGPCVIESEQFALDTAGKLKEITAAFTTFHFIYKSSFDKANRTSSKSFRGLGIEEGLRILEAVKKAIAVPVLTDVHEDTPIEEVASVVDVLQTPAFLCRQTNFIQRVAQPEYCL